MRGKHRKMFSIENIFKENNFSENIFQWKPFYVKVNRALEKKFGLIMRKPKQNLEILFLRSCATH